MEKSIIISLKVDELQSIIIDCVNVCLKNQTGKKEFLIPQPDKLLNVEETANFLHLSKATIYSKVSKGELPHSKKGKRLYFSTKDLEGYIKSGRVKTNKEIDEDAQHYINNKKG